ncbi:NADH-quinone oxidoreductase subunit J [candidate division LCP-89 bacterium B3_LCP]|uniref:NADH-quinone oxidoreductase subunit J n=1 Tax=candidate division LCP-89 bacterium B3_LCP TaxID=2012998 RepID=A0A532USP0_UNCL8|nr:MAG: NADH-quinone oxidoreductase subunit J [candidate division LCP-89 bacterium B3_LCP]
MEAIFFIILSIIIIFSSMMVILKKNPIASVLFLILALFSTAAMYVMLMAPFIAAIQIIVYAGAIMVLFLFVIMLLNLKKINEGGAVTLKILGVIVAGLMMVVTAVVLRSVAIPADSGFLRSSPEGFGTVENVGMTLFTTYLLPFEIASFLLLAAIIGAVVLAKKKL